jgi:SAM-dependent methyltransferase
MTEPSWVSDGIDLNLPTAARMYDYYLGGFHNFAADRVLAQKAIDEWPDLPLTMKANRAFLRRVVTDLVGLGVRQFLDIGSGIPTAGNVHEVAQALAPQARVVYVDIDPVAVAHSQAILTDNANAGVASGDLRRPAEILADPSVAGLLDMNQPVALLMFAVLHFVKEQEGPGELLATFRDALAPGSYLAISHGTHEVREPESASTATDLYQQTATPFTTRTRSQVQNLFDGFDLLDPGVVLVERWRPGPTQDVEGAERYPVWAGVGRKA